jgi:hypothetical protein
MWSVVEVDEVEEVKMTIAKEKAKSLRSASVA